MTVVLLPASPALYQKNNTLDCRNLFCFDERKRCNGRTGPDRKGPSSADVEKVKGKDLIRDHSLSVAPGQHLCIICQSNLQIMQNDAFDFLQIHHSSGKFFVESIRAKHRPEKPPKTITIFWYSQIVSGVNLISGKKKCR